MSCLTLVLASAAFLSGCIGAFYWYKASKVMVMPMALMNGKLVPIRVEEDLPAWIRSVYLGVNKSGALNKAAALWSAVSVICGAAATLAGSIGGHGA